MFNWTNFSITEHNSQVLVLDHYTTLTVSGEDAEKFIQGQCTCDAGLIRAGLFKQGAHCNHKGRMQSQFFAALSDAQSITLRLRKETAELALNALKKYIVFSKADITQSSMAVVGITGETVEQILSTIGLELEVGRSGFKEGATFLRHQTDLLEVWLNGAAMQSLWQIFEPYAPCFGANTWSHINIARGVAELTPELVEQLIPQEMNMQWTDGISFNKGCYTGQEVIARMHHRATLKKHMYRGKVSLDHLPPSGSPLISEGRTCGTLINVAKIDKKTYEVLALCSDSAFSDKTASLEQNPQSIIQWLPLPYAIH